MTVLHDLNSDNIMTYLAYCAISTYGELPSKHKNIPDHMIHILCNVMLSHSCEQFMTFQRIVMLHLQSQAFPYR